MTRPESSEVHPLTPDPCADEHAPVVPSPLRSSILVVDDDELLRGSLVEVLESAGHRALAAGCAQSALDLCAEGVDLVLLDYWLPDTDGLTVLSRMKSLDPDALIIVMTGHSSVETAVEAMRRGAYDYLCKPFCADELLLLAAKALETTRLRREVKTLRQRAGQPYSLDSLIGNSPQMRAIKTLLTKVAASPASTVLLTGESGTGKDLAARVIHHHSDRAAHPFMNITCSALPETLLESELFGHERGAFTDAKQQKKGMIELARGGSLFLDEIGEMSPAL